MVEEQSLEELLKELRNVDLKDSGSTESKPRLREEVEVKVVPGIGVLGVDIELEEMKGRVKLSKIHKRRKQAQEHRKKQWTKANRKVRAKKKMYKRQAKYAKKKRQASRPERSKVYRETLYGSDPKASYDLICELQAKRRVDWQITYEEWLEYIWPVFSTNYVYIRKCVSDRPMTLGNVWLQDRLACKSEGKHPGFRQREAKPQGVLFDGMELEMKRLGMLDE